MAYHPKNILVTGAAGFIGSHFVKYLIRHYDHIQVVSLDKLTYAGNLENLGDALNKTTHRFERADIGDSDKIPSILNQYNIDTIVHFAAESHVDHSIKKPQNFASTNVMGTLNLLQHAKSFWQTKQWGPTQCRFHHISTDEVYGSLNAQDQAFTETHCYQPNSPYAASKAAADHFVKAYYKTYHLPVTISNCSNNFGPYQHAEKLIPTIIRCCLQQSPIPIYGDGSNRRDWLYVETHCDIIDKVIRHGQVGETYNIGGGCEIDNLTLAKKICQLIDQHDPQYAPCERLIRLVKDRPGHDWRYAIDNTKVANLLGYTPEHNFDEALKKTVWFYCRKFKQTELCL